MDDDERIMSCIFETLLIWIVTNGLLRQPLSECPHNNVPHGMLFQDVIDLGLRCAEEKLTLGGFEEGEYALDAVPWRG